MSGPRLYSEEDATHQAYDIFLELAPNNLSEKDIDTYRAPHPLIGKLTVRELVYFSIYHVGHHHKSIQKLLKK